MLVELVRGVALLAAGVDVREVGQLVVGAQLQEKLEDFVEHFVRPSVRPIDLVDDHDRLQSALQGLGEHEAGLRHRPFSGIDQHQRPVGHSQHALDLAAEIGVAGRVDDVDLHALIRDGDVLGEDRDAPLALQVVGVEDLLADQLRVAIPAALPQHAIDKRRLAVVNVGDNGDVSHVLPSHGRGLAVAE